MTLLHWTYNIATPKVIVTCMYDAAFVPILLLNYLTLSGHTIWIQHKPFWCSVCVYLVVELLDIWSYHLNSTQNILMQRLCLSCCWITWHLVVPSQFNTTHFDDLSNIPCIRRVGCHSVWILRTLFWWTINSSIDRRNGQPFFWIPQAPIDKNLYGPNGPTSENRFLSGIFR